MTKLIGLSKFDILLEKLQAGEKLTKIELENHGIGTSCKL